MASINEAAKGRTNIVIAHRLSTIMDSNCIIVLKDGEVRPGHPSLTTPRGLYRAMWDQQVQSALDAVRRDHLTLSTRSGGGGEEMKSVSSSFADVVFSLFARRRAPRVSIAPPRVVTSSPPFPSRGKSHRSRDRTRIARVPHPPKTARSVDPPPSPRGGNPPLQTPLALTPSPPLSTRAPPLWTRTALPSVARAPRPPPRVLARVAPPPRLRVLAHPLARGVLLAHLFQSYPAHRPCAASRMPSICPRSSSAREGGVAVLRGDFEGVRARSRRRVALREGRAGLLERLGEARAPRGGGGRGPVDGSGCPGASSRVSPAASSASRASRWVMAASARASACLARAIAQETWARRGTCSPRRRFSVATVSACSMLHRSASRTSSSRMRSRNASRSSSASCSASRRIRAPASGSRRAPSRSGFAASSRFRASSASTRLAIAVPGLERVDAVSRSRFRASSASMRDSRSRFRASSASMQTRGRATTRRRRSPSFAMQSGGAVLAWTATVPSHGSGALERAPRR